MGSGVGLSDCRLAGRCCWSPLLRGEAIRQSQACHRPLRPLHPPRPPPPRPRALLPLLPPPRVPLPAPPAVRAAVAERDPAACPAAVADRPLPVPRAPPRPPPRLAPPGIGAKNRSVTTLTMLFTDVFVMNDILNSLRGGV